MVKINGESLDAAGRTIAAYLAEAGYDVAKVAVERNGEIVPRAEYEEMTFCDGDTAEIVSFVGGG